MLLGHATIENAVNGLSAGLAEGYQITAANAGSRYSAPAHRQVAPETQQVDGTTN
jgi:hypothetical protein